MAVPDRWVLDGYPVRVVVPSTSTLVRSMLAEPSGLWTVMACTDPRDYAYLWARASAPVRPLTLGTLDLVADALVQRVTGWHRWEAEHVWVSTVGAWHAVDGDLRAAGVDVLGLPAHAATNTAYAWFRRNLGRDEKEWKKFVRDMTHEPVRVLAAKADEGMALDAFEQMQALTGGGSGAGDS